MQTYFDIHLCLISQQAAANLIPVIQDDFKPKKVIFIVSNEMKEQAGYLEGLFKSLALKVEQIFIQDVTDFEELERIFIDIVIQYNAENIALNVTGGTKLMAIAAQNAFVLASKPIFYLDTKNNRILLLPNESNKNIRYLALNTPNKLKYMLQAYGGTIIEQSSQPSKEEFTRYKQYIEELMLYSYQYNDSLPLLNQYIVPNLKNGNKKIDVSADAKVNIFMTHLKELEKMDFLTFATDNTVQFNNHKDMQFLAGGWLEHLVYEVISKKLKDHIQDCALNLEIGRPSYNENTKRKHTNHGKNNEFDVVFLANDTVHIIECKTSKNEAIIDASLNKMATLKSYGGLMTKLCLVSYFPITDAQKNRAKELNIKVVEAADLNQITEKLKVWIKNDR